MNKLSVVFKYVCLSVASFLCLFPFFWMVVGATNAGNDVLKGKLTPGNQLFNNAANACFGTNLVRSSLNSLIIAVIVLIFSLLFCSMAGYAFEIFPSKKREAVMGVILFSMMIPFAGIMIPLYTLFGKVHLLNRFGAVILPNIATAFLIFFFRQNTKSFPKELIEAARIDGVSETGIFFKIYVPAMKSTYAAAAIITFMNTWNNYMWPLIALQSPDKQTLPIVISSLGCSTVPDYGMIMFLLVIATIPTAALFFGLQKSFVEGMVGSVKG